MSDFPSERCGMSTIAGEASLLVRRVAEPRPVGDSIKAAIVRTARRLGFSYTRTRDIWYGNARRIDAAEMDQLREYAGRREAQIAIENMVVLRERLAKTDAEFHRQTIALLDSTLRQMGADVRALAIRED